MRIALITMTIIVSTALAQPPSADTAEQVLKDSPRHGEWVDIPIKDREIKLHTWVVYPERKEKAPVVIVIHEIFGMTDWVRSVADQLAAEGYIAVAPDLLSGKGPKGGGTDSLGDRARDAVGRLNKDEVVERLDVARDYALALPAANGKSATIGFCWGGGMSFGYATRQPKLNAAIVCYGQPPGDKESLERIQCPVLGLYGGDDARITQTVEPTAKTMEELKKSYDHHVYDGAGHGFFRQQDGRGGANAKAAKEGWTEVVAFLKKNLQ